ncbi:MAG: RNA polymerase Rpb4 [Candidatus Bathyarchaeales archaeon]
MSKKPQEEKLLTLPEVKELLESLSEEQLDQFQRRTLDYTAKFSKITPDNAEKLTQKLVKEFELEPTEAIEIVNCMPASVEEIRVFLGGGKKIIETAKIETILSLLNQYRKKP